MALTGLGEPSGFDWSHNRVANVIKGATIGGIAVGMLVTPLGDKLGTVGTVAAMRVVGNRAPYAVMAARGGARQGIARYCAASRNQQTTTGCQTPVSVLRHVS